MRLAGIAQTHPGHLDTALTVGPRPADKALDALDAAMPDSPHPYWLGFRAWLLGMQGRIEEAEAVATEARDRSLEVSGTPGVTDWTTAEVAALGGDHERAIRHLERQCETLEARGRQAELSTYKGRLAIELCAVGRFEEAERLGHKSNELGDAHDTYTQAAWRQALARVAAHRGDHEAAERLAREAVTIINQTDSPILQAAALSDLAHVLESSGQREDAAGALRDAIERYQRKGNIVMAKRLRERLTALGPISGQL